MKTKIVFIGYFLLFAITVAGAKTQPKVKLKTGKNEVIIKVQNKSNLDLQTIQVIVKDEDLPEGISLTKITQHLNVLAKSKSNYGLVLNFNVANNSKDGIHTIPFILKDKNNRRWNFKLTAEIETTKPEICNLFENFPNPFNPKTKIKYQLTNEKEQYTKLIIFDVLGKPVRTLVNEKQLSGEYTIEWDGKDDYGQHVSSGLYIYKLSSGSYTQIKKMTLLK